MRHSNRLIEQIVAAPEGARRAADILRRRGKRLKAELPQAVRPTAKGKSILETDILDLAAALDAPIRLPPAKS